MALMISGGIEVKQNNQFVMISVTNGLILCIIQVSYKNSWLCCISIPVSGVFPTAVRHDCHSASLL